MSFGGGGFGTNRPTGFGTSTTPGTGGFGSTGAGGFGSTSTGFGQPASTGFGAGGLGGGTTGFGATTQTPSTVFGSSTGATSTGFGGGAKFGSPTTGFGQASTTPAFGQSSTGGGLGGMGGGGGFGSATPSFGSTTPGGFGTSTLGGGGGTSTGGSLFGSPATSGTGGFGAASQTGGGAAPFGTTGGFGQASTTPGGAFGATTTSQFGGSTAFGAAPAPTTGAFGTATSFGTPGQPTTGGFGGMGGGATAWGAGSTLGGARAAQPGTGNPPYKPTQHHDTNTNVPTYIQAITAMDAYKEKCFEELRWEDYQRGNNKGGPGVGVSPLQGGLGLGGTSAFGGGLGNTGGGLGLGGGGAFGHQPPSTGFGSTTGGAFGSTTTPGTSAFGASTGFGSAAKPAGGFGAATTTPGGFGSTTTTSTPLFGQTPSLQAHTGGFGTGSTLGGGTTAFGTATPAPAPTPFGATTSTFGGTGGAFGTTNTTPLGGGLQSAGGGFGSFGQAKAPSPGGFGTTFGTPSTTSAFGTPASAPGTGLKPFGSSSFGTPAPATGLGGFGATTPSIGGFGATTTTPGFSSAFGKSPSLGTTPAFSGFGTGGGGGGFGTTPGGMGSTTPFSTTTPLATPNFALGGNSMQSALQQQPQTPQQSMLFAQPSLGGTPSLGGLMAPSMAAPAQGLLQFVVSGSGSKRNVVSRVRSDSLEATPSALQSYRHTPRSAAKIVPRGLRMADTYSGGRRVGGDGKGGGGVRHEDHPIIVSPGADSFAGRSHKQLDIGREDIFAAESKIFDMEDLRQDRGHLEGGSPVLRGASSMQGGGGGGGLSSPTRPVGLPSPGDRRSNGGRGGPSSGRNGGGVGESKATSSASLPNQRRVRVPLLTLEDYWTSPPINELQEIDEHQLQHVRNFSITREGVGRIEWEGETDVLGLNLDRIVKIQPKEVRVYEDSIKDPEGHKLNKPAIITLFSVKHKKRSPEEYREHLIRVVQNWDGAQFINYDLRTGCWTFRVAHFSKYGVADDDDDEHKDGGGRATTTTTAATAAAGPEEETSNALVQSSQQQTKGIGYGVMDSDEESNEGELSGMVVAEVEEYGRGGEDLDDFEEPSGTRRSIGMTYGMEQNRIKSLVGIFGDGTEDHYEEAGERSSYPPPTTYTREFKEQEEGGTWFRSPPKLGRISAPRGWRRQERAPTTMAGEMDVEEETEPTIQTAPSMLLRGTFSYIEPQDMQGVGAIGTPFPDPSKKTDVGGKRKPMDYSSFMGRSFRVGWGPGGLLVLPFMGKPVASANKRQSKEVAQVKKLGFNVAVKLLSVTPYKVPVDSYLGPLKVHKAHSQKVQDGQAHVAPTFALSSTSSLQEAASGDRISTNQYLHLVQCLQALAQDASEQDPLIFQTWELLNALWGQEAAGKARALPLTGSLSSIGRDLLRQTPTSNDWERRRQAVCRWLKMAVRKETESIPVKPTGDEEEDLKNILELIRGHRIGEACTLAAEAGFLRLATLIPLIGHKPATDYILSQAPLYQHLEDPNLSAIYGLLSGSSQLASPAEPDYSVDWMRSLGKYLWYTTDDIPTHGTPNMDGLVAAIQEFNDCKPAAPLPAWMVDGRRGLPDDDHDTRKGPNSIFYDLLQVYRNETYPFSLVLDPRGLTENELDYRVSWLVMTLMFAFGMGPSPRTSKLERDLLWHHVTFSMVFQLTSVGLWEWAVYVLLHTTEVEKTPLVKEVLVRYGWKCSKGSSEWNFLVKELGIPKEWLEDARATYLRSAGVLFNGEASSSHAGGGSSDDALSHAFEAGDYSLASEIIMVIAAPRLLTDDRATHLNELLSRLYEQGGGEGVFRGMQGKACLEYLRYLEGLGDLETWGSAKVTLVENLLPGLNSDDSSFGWRSKRLGPEEGGYAHDMYAEENGAGDDEVQPPQQRAIRAMVLSDVIKKLFFFHRLNRRTLATSDEGEKIINCFPRESQTCNLKDMLPDYGLQQVGYLVGDFIDGVTASDL